MTSEQFSKAVAINARIAEAKSHLENFKSRASRNPMNVLIYVPGQSNFTLDPKFMPVDIPSFILVYTSKVEAYINSLKEEMEAI